MEKDILFTKSRLKTTLECQTKLYYLDKKEYANKSKEDTFLQALAEGGYHIGALAKCYYPGGTEVEGKGYEEPINRTNELLKLDKVVIFEAAFRYKNLFVRTDILIKNGNTIKIIEVKAKSFDPNDPESSFYGKKNKFIREKWIPYIYDIAFQKYVVIKSFQENNPVSVAEIQAYLMLADKSKTASVDGLSQKFLILKDKNGRTYVKTNGDVSLEALGEKILTEFPVDDLLELIYKSEQGKKYLSAEFEDYINSISEMFMQNKKIITPLGKKCKSCEFRTRPGENNFKSGFKECWTEKAGFKEEDFSKQLIYDVWNYDKNIVDNKINKGCYFMDDLKEQDFNITDIVDNQILSKSERQWIQVEKCINKDPTPYVYYDGLRDEMKSFNTPYHFIDFETAMPAIPFYKSLRPYEGIAFQFSHHIIHEDGTIEHKGEYINDIPGVFPNYEFARKLKDELEKDNGTIFRYATHENTYLRLIHEQLLNSNGKDIPDKEELCKWIDSITEYKPGKVKIKGARNMVDMNDLVIKYYYNPFTNGSNSIKDVLPAVLNSSEFLRNKYSKPIYGVEGCIRSLNFKDWIWIIYDENKRVIDPYMLLSEVFNNETSEDVERINNDVTIHGGGAAMTAYAKMQYTQMTDDERKKIREALLRYCELDTFAMVMIFEYWKHECLK